MCSTPLNFTRKSLSDQTDLLKILDSDYITCAFSYQTIYIGY